MTESKQIHLFIPEVADYKRINGEIRTEMIKVIAINSKLKKIIIKMACCGNCNNIDCLKKGQVCNDWLLKA